MIDDPSNKLEPDKEFERTEIPQENPFRSDANILSNDKKEELQTWIVKTSVNKTITIGLPKKDCPKCKKSIYDGNSICPYCYYSYDQCIITGHPINTNSDTISCSNCKKKALREAWKEWISHNEQCPFCKSVQISYK